MLDQFLLLETLVAAEFGRDSCYALSVIHNNLNEHKN